MALVKRLVKGAPLTFAEGDANLDYLEGLSTSITWDGVGNKPITGSIENASSGSTSLYSVATGSYLAAFFDYVVKNGSNSRAGTVMSTWNGGSVAYTDNTTTDIGNTNEVTMSAILNNGEIVLRSTTTNSWEVRVLTRLI